MRLISKMVLLTALLTLFTGLFAATDAHAEGTSYFFNRRSAANAEFALVGPHASLDAANNAIRWSMDNGYEVEWEVDGSAPRILVEDSAPAVDAPAKVVVVYVKPAYTWHYWNSYRHYWRSWKVKVRWRGWRSYYGYRFFKHKHHHDHHNHDNWKTWKKNKKNGGLKVNKKTFKKAKKKFKKFKSKLKKKFKKKKN